MRVTYKHTTYACFFGYIVQAIVNNFVPLLFLTFQATYHISLSKITFLITFNFGLQLLVDFLMAGITDKIGYRNAAVAAHVFAALGLIFLVVLPGLFRDPFIGLMIAVMIYAIGGGIIEILVSPIVEACPNENKEAAMSLLHSFYCWGHVAVVLLSTIFFAVFGIHNWRVLAILWALIPILNAIAFTKVPIGSLIKDGETGLTIKELFTSKIFWLMLLLMVTAGASEQSVSQWTSALAEKGLGVSKVIGDLAGPMLFASMMGLSRAIYGKSEKTPNLQKTILCSGVLCILSYLIIFLSAWPVLGFIGCGLCGFSVGIFWPGTFSIAAAQIRRGGTAMFAYLALAGDLGCALGPTVVGRISGMAGDNLQLGILAAIIFPALLVLGILISMINVKKIETEDSSQ